MLMADRLFAGFIVILGLIGLIGSWELSGEALRGGPGPGMMPRALALILIVLAGGYLAFLLARPPKTDKAFTNSYALKRQALLIGALSASALLSYLVGMLISMGLFIIFVLGVIEKFPWKKSILVGVATIISVHFIFERWMGLQLLKGIFF